MRRLNTISLIWRNVPRYAQFIASEFAIDGRLLQSHLESATKQSINFVSPLGWIAPDLGRSNARRLLLLDTPVLPSGRCDLLVCPECAALGCGCLSAEVTIADGHVIWSRFGIENDYDPDSLKLFEIGAFVFALHEYTGLLRGHAQASEAEV